MLTRKTLSRLCTAVALSVPAFSAAAQDQTALQVFAGESTRAVSRIGYWDNATQSLPGQFSITHGTPPWKSEYAGALEQLKGQRFRLGDNNWPTFDTNIPLTIAGKSIAPGIYYLAMECSKDGDFSLVFLDPKEIMTKRLDAFQAGQTTGGIVIPLKHSTVETISEKLTMKLKRGEVDVKKATLEIAWGPHKATAPIAASFQS